VSYFVVLLFLNLQQDIMQTERYHEPFPFSNAGYKACMDKGYIQAGQKMAAVDLAPNNTKPVIVPACIPLRGGIKRTQ
jgi:hypothetical protein